MSTIEVNDIPEVWLQRLDKRARERGSDRSEIVREILARELDHENPIPAVGFDAVLSTIRQGFAESGDSEEELTALLEEGLRATRSSQQSDSCLKLMTASFLSILGVLIANKVRLHNKIVWNQSKNDNANCVESCIGYRGISSRYD